MYFGVGSKYFNLINMVQINLYFFYIHYLFFAVYFADFLYNKLCINKDDHYLFLQYHNHICKLLFICIHFAYYYGQGLIGIFDHIIGCCHTCLHYVFSEIPLVLLRHIQIIQLNLF